MTFYRGKSAMEGAQKLKSAGLNVHDIVVFMDHEQGVKDSYEKMVIGVMQF